MQNIQKFQFKMYASANVSTLQSIGIATFTKRDVKVLEGIHSFS